MDDAGRYDDVGHVKRAWLLLYAYNPHAGPLRKPRAKAALRQTLSATLRGISEARWSRAGLARSCGKTATSRAPRGSSSASCKCVQLLAPDPKLRACRWDADDVRGSYRRHFHDLVSRGVGPNDAAALAIKFASGTGESSNPAAPPRPPAAVQSWLERR